MEEWLDAFVDKDVVLTICRKGGRRFERNARIVGLEDGFVKVRGASGMVVAIPLDDEYMKVEGVRIEFPETDRAE